MQIRLAPTAGPTDQSRVRCAATIALFLGLSAPGHAAVTTSYSDVGMTFSGTLCLDAATGRVLSESQADAPGRPASVTKLMTFLLVLEDLQAGLTTLQKRVTITREAPREIGSKVWLAVAESFTVEQLLYALMLKSANDAAVALAVDRAGSTATFVERMNRRALELGMRNTRYVTPNGMTQGRGPHDTTTARDLGKLCLTLSKLPLAYRFTSAKTYAFRRPLQTLELENHNKLLGLFPGCDGFKTGWTEAAQASIATTAQAGEHRVIAIVLSCKSPAGAKAAQRLRDQMAANLMTAGLARLEAQAAEKARLAAQAPRTTPAAKKALIVKKEAGFWDWLVDLFSF